MNCDELLKTLNILYAEDEEGIRETLKDVLEEEFNRFETAKNGKEALDLFINRSFDIVITDIEMPIMNGMEFAKEIKNISQNTPVLLLTAYSEKERLFEAIDIGINKYLVKPFTPEKLLETICEIAKKFTSLKVKIGDNFYYDKLKRTIFDKEGKIVNLTKKELSFLELLIKNRKRAVRVEEIKNEIWEDETFTQNALRTLVKRVRQKTSKEIIRNFPAIGYGIL